MGQINLLEHGFPLRNTSYYGYKQKKPGLMDLMQGASPRNVFSSSVFSNSSFKAQTITAYLELRRQLLAAQFVTDVERRDICESELS